MMFPTSRTRHGAGRVQRWRRPRHALGSGQRLLRTMPALLALNERPHLGRPHGDIREGQGLRAEEGGAAGEGGHEV